MRRALGARRKADFGVEDEDDDEDESEEELEDELELSDFLSTRLASLESAPAFADASVSRLRRAVP